MKSHRKPKKSWLDGRVGHRVGMLVIIGSCREGGRIKAIVRCDCGKQKTAQPENFKNNPYASCGCDRWRNRVKARNGLSASRACASWRHMIDRCTKRDHHKFYRYGARGITVCERWFSFDNFLLDMGPCPDGLELDRIDNDGNYEPANCRWATRKTQTNNTSRNIFVDYEGERLTVTQISERFGIEPNVVRKRLARGWPLDVALLAKPDRHIQFRDKSKISLDAYVAGLQKSYSEAA